MSRTIQDPLLRRISAGPDDEPSHAELLKDSGEDGTSSSGASPAGRSAISAASGGSPLSMLQVLGPGLVTGASDDDPSGIGTYSQAGSQFGLGLLWTAAFTFPLMVAMQELCARIALHTGVGLGTSLRRRFPASLVGICIGAMVIANTINLGADLGAVAAGGELLSRGHVPRLALVVPVALLVLALQFTATYGRIFKAFKWLTLALFTYVITAFVAHPALLDMLRATFVPHVEWSVDFLMTLVAILGTTISPYLFIWQASSEVDEMKAAGQHTERERRGVQHAELKAARVDIVVGMAFSQIVMYSIILTAGNLLHAHGQTGVASADQAAKALEPLAGPLAFVLFAAGMIGTGLLAIPILSGSAAYAVKDLTGIEGDLASKATFRPTFYAIIAISTLVGVGMNFLNIDPIRALFLTAVINGVVAPPLMLLIVLLGSDRSVMHHRVSGRLSKAVSWIATALMGAAALLLVGTLVVHGSG